MPLSTQCSFQPGQQEFDWNNSFHLMKTYDTQWYAIFIHVQYWVTFASDKLILFSHWLHFFTIIFLFKETLLRLQKVSSWINLYIAAQHIKLQRTSNFWISLKVRSYWWSYRMCLTVNPLPSKCEWSMAAKMLISLWPARCIPCIGTNIFS